MTRKTPQEIRIDNTKSRWADVKNLGLLLGVTLSTAALLGMCGAVYVKWDSVATQADLRNTKSEILTTTSHNLAKERAESEALGMHEMRVTEERLELKIGGVEKDVQYIKSATDANGRRLEKLMDKIDALPRRRYQ